MAPDHAEIRQTTKRITSIPLRPRRGLATLATAGVLFAAGGIPFQWTSSWTEVSVWADSVVPNLPADPDRKDTILATHFMSDVDGSVKAIRFFQSAENAGPHTGWFWTKDGQVLATVTFAAADGTGWRRADLATPVAITAGTEYVVGYRAPQGRYADDVFLLGPNKTVKNGPLTAISSSYSYDGSFPVKRWNDSSYYVDVVFKQGRGTQPTPTTTTTAPSPTPTTTTPTTPPTSTTTTSTPPTSTTTTSTSPSPTTTVPTSPPPTGPNLLDLPRVPWNGGPAYFSAFPDAAANGWTSPDFFPIGVWWGVWSSDEEVKWDKSLGINTYIITHPNADLGLLERNGMSYIGGSVGGATRSAKAWVGDFLDDEVDGRYEPADGQAFLQSLVDALPDHRKLRYANYTGMVLAWMNQRDAEKYVNAYTDAVSVDQYWYSTEYCSWTEYQGWAFLIPIPQDTCRTGHSYGQVVDMLHQRDAADGKSQSIWNFVEAVYGSDNYVMPMSPEQVKAAAWQIVIHEGRGIVWFNNAFGGPCSTGNAIRTTQLQPNYACAANVLAMGEANNQIRRLAPVINTQSYAWNFGPGLSTMLKAKDGYAYVFAGTDGHAGSKTLTLPAGISGTTAEVIDENRSVRVTNGQIVDNFSQEWVYHIYKIKI